MKLIVIHKRTDSPLNNSRAHFAKRPQNANLGGGLLQFVVCSEPFADIIFSCLSGDAGVGKGHLAIRGDSWHRSSKIVIEIPQDWVAQTTKIKSNMIYYRENLPVPQEVRCRLKANSWFIISDGRFATQTDYQRLYRILAQLQTDVAAVNVTAKLQAFHEKILTTPRSKLVGFRRFYEDLAQPAPIPNDWPHYIFIKTDVLRKLLLDDALPLAFSEFINRCSLSSLTVRSLNIGGTVLDLDTEDGLIGLLTSRLSFSVWNLPNANSKSQKEVLEKNGITISPDARLFGKILFGQNISIGKNAIIAGPTVIGNNVEIAEGAVISRSVVGTGVSVPRNHIIRSSVLIGSVPKRKEIYRSPGTNAAVACEVSGANNFRTWPRFSYARCLKRIADIIASLAVLILFAPVFPILALAIKLSSSGPVFFKNKRQGLHGKEFFCLKFRTMIIGAESIQEKLRFKSLVDGPQFKMKDDPRTTVVGKFLRDTFIDEIPQFLNILLGQMSVVGPRPSPRAENSLCPVWHDARLSVRPGITGPWQIYRTRRPGYDFQEWIYYDTKYITELSLRWDLLICWQTAKKLIANFISQF